MSGPGRRQAAATSAVNSDAGVSSQRQQQFEGLAQAITVGRLPQAFPDGIERRCLDGGQDLEAPDRVAESAEDLERRKSTDQLRLVAAIAEETMGRIDRDPGGLFSLEPGDRLIGVRVGLKGQGLGRGDHLEEERQASEPVGDL